MNREIQKRKKRFWACCLAIMLVLVQTIPADVIAEAYTVTYTPEGAVFSLGTDFLKPADTITFDVNPDSSQANVNIYYVDSDGSDDSDGTTLCNITLNLADSANTQNIYTVLSYAEACSNGSVTSPKLSEEAFKGWDVTDIDGSGGCLNYLKLTAVAYAQSNIEYELNGGINDSTNPSTYYEGKEVITLANATKTGYTFIGWYSDALFTSDPITSIPTTQTGNVKLYAKFLPNYNITYKLDGGTNPASNPLSYTQGIGVDSFADASKEGYTFEGWYSDAEFTTPPVTSISATQTGDVELYAKYKANTYDIYYELNGGTNGADNPATYTYGTGVTSFANASKEGYTFDGWYSDAEFKVKVTSISTTQTGAMTLYAKFTKNITDGTGSIRVDDVYYGESIKPVLTSSTNGTDHVTIEYKKKGEADSSYTTKQPVKAGNYTARATFAKTDDYYQVVATDDFSILKKQGTGSVTVADVHYGELPKPVVVSSTNGTDDVKIEYKPKDALDDKYTSLKPVKIGTYTVRVTFAETEEYLKVTATDDFTIRYLKAPKLSYKIRGTMGDNDYYTSVVTIIPAKGYMIADSLDGKYKTTLELTKSTDSFFIYLKDTKTGEKTSGIEVPALKIDKDAPAILNAVSGETIYAEKTEIIIKDDHLKQVSVNDSEVEFKKGTAVLQLASNQGEEQYDIIAVDEAGNRSEIHITVAAEWMKSKVVPSGVKVRLYKKYSYQLGGGTWNVEGDTTSYTGNSEFYVNNDGDYSFSNGN
ncbi:MAG: InlB B-repeat-containing protein [Lachnospiraceae bacterium]